MAHFAELDDTNTVVRVISVSNDVAIDEASGQDFIANVLKLGGVWKQTSYNTYRKYEAVWSDDEPPHAIDYIYVGSAHANGGTPFRGQYAGIGDTYDAELDQFVSPTNPE